MSKIVDFGVSDVAMDDEEIVKVNGEVVMFFMIVGSIVMVYNLFGVEGLKLFQEVLVGIMLGNIIKWNDFKLVVDNFDLILFDCFIMVVYCFDGSGIMVVFIMNLVVMSFEFKEIIGDGKIVEWLISKGKFIGGKGNEGVIVGI